MRTINVQQILGSVNIAANAYLKNRFAMTMTEIHSVPDCCGYDNFLGCGDDSDEDEEMCRNYTCLPGFWKTRSHKCIPVGLVCDGNINSADCSDEVNCEAYTCT